MGKHEFNSPKAIANRIKAKGLQKIKYYCEICKKQCRDANGFKCHINSPAHQDAALAVSEGIDRLVNEKSKQFMDGFLHILRARYRTVKILANTVFQEYIKERDHIHMNGTRWTSLTEFANWMGQQGIVEVQDSERGVMITYIDNDPETVRRRELDAKREQQALEAAQRAQEEIEHQIKTTREIYDKIHEPEPEIKPIEIEENDEKPVFGLQTIALGTAQKSSYKPAPPKKRVLRKDKDKTKKLKQ